MSKAEKIDGYKDGDPIMAESNILEIVQGLAQAAANGYDGAHDERYSHDGKARKVGLKREEGEIMLDKRVNDGFKVKFAGNQICIHYQSDIMLKEIYKGGFENEMARMINEIKKYPLSGSLFKIDTNSKGKKMECFKVSNLTF